MSYEVGALGAAYLLAGGAALRFGPWRDSISTLVLELRLLSALPLPEEDGSSDSGESTTRQLPWRVKTAEILLWTGGVLLWPFSLWSWGRKACLAWRSRRESDQQLWIRKGKVSTCPPKLSVAFVRTLTPAEALEASRTQQRPPPMAVVGFEADDAAEVLAAFVAENPHLLAGEHGEALQWLRHRDKSSVVVGYSRIGWWPPIETAAIELMKSGKCVVKCTACDKKFSGTEIDCKPWECWMPAGEDFNGGGAAGENFRCPEGHLLCENVTRIA